jgi:diadenosine tetraphosphate (Ap4A) HIT family hydrolase
MSYDKNNIFAKIIRGEIPATKIYEDEKVLAFLDISKAAPTHLLVVPKAEYIDFMDFTARASADEIANFFTQVNKIAGILNVVDAGFRLIANIGSNAHQTVPHFHVHILAGKKLGPLISSDKSLR